jgi:hypothetical protein
MQENKDCFFEKSSKKLLLLLASASAGWALPGTTAAICVCLQ